jgi:DNA-nicking Smr family endonuclease
MRRKESGEVSNAVRSAFCFSSSRWRNTSVKIPIEDSLDLHAFAPRDVQSVVEEYVTAAHEAGLREVRLIHGRGKGVQRGLVQQALERHPLVVQFWDATETHLGATVARLSK